MAGWFCKVWFGFWHLFPKWFLCWMPWPNHFPLCAFQCLRFSFLYICLPVSHMHFWAKQVYVWGFLSAFGKERVRKLCWVSWFVSPPTVSLLDALAGWFCCQYEVYVFEYVSPKFAKLDAEAGWFCSTCVYRYDFVPSYFVSHSLFFSFIHTLSIWIDINL